MTIGVYAVINKADKKMYIGSSSNVERRLVHHKSHIKRGHATLITALRNLVLDVNDFDFQLIAKTESIKDARKFETALLQSAWGQSWLYNLAPHADGASGLTRNPEKYKTGAAKRNSNPDYAKKLSVACKGKREIVTCPHCALSGGGGNMRRYHFDKCAKK